MAKESLVWDVTGRDVPRGLWPGGRVRVRYGTRRREDVKRSRAALEALRHWHAWDVIRAIQRDTLPLTRAVAAVKERGEGAVAELRRSIEAERAGAIPTVRQEADAYLEWYKRERAAASAKQLRSRLKRFCEQSVPAEGETMVPVGGIRMDRLMGSEIEAAIHGVGGADATREAIRLAVSGLFTWSRREEAEAARVQNRQPRWSENPAGKVERKPRGKRVTTASEEQMLRLLAAAEIYQEAYMRPLAHMGIRDAELVHTRLHADLDVTEWIWRIQPRPKDTRCGCVSCRSERGWRPKSRRSIRTLLVPEHPAALRASILRYLEHYPCQPGDFVFRNPRTNRVWDAGRFDADLAALCARAEVRYGSKVAGGITTHTLRHTCATGLLRAGVDSAIIAELLGDTVKTIVDTYFHLTARDVAAAVEKGPSYAV